MERQDGSSAMLQYQAPSRPRCSLDTANNFTAAQELIFFALHGSRALKLKQEMQR